MKAIRSFETSINTTSHSNSVVFSCEGLRSSVLVDMADVSNVPTEAVVIFVKLFYIKVCGRGGRVEDAVLREIIGLNSVFVTKYI